jgi:hypothetical protein
MRINPGFAGAQALYLFGLSERTAVLDLAFKRRSKWTVRSATAHPRFPERQAS